MLACLAANAPKDGRMIMDDYLLDRTLVWNKGDGSDAHLLRGVQANIVRAHVRDHLRLLLLRFADGNQGRSEGKDFLRAVAAPGLMKSAAVHLSEVSDFDRARRPGTPYVGVAISAVGYAALGLKPIPDDPAFRRGMKDPDTNRRLLDPAVTTWEQAYRGVIHAVIIIGDADEAAVARRRADVLGLLTPTITLVAEEVGRAQFNANNDTVEHFGYVDGRSQPLFLQEDAEREQARTVGPLRWEPALPARLVLVPEKAASARGMTYGSYLVLRKLEQNVRVFKQSESDLADALDLPPSERERAGAMMVGRFEDGTPITLYGRAGALLPVTNNFDYREDKAGMKCPFQAHIRKVNPRLSSGDDRFRVMARRGVPYGERLDEINEDLPPAARPAEGVGLLFMAFSANIGEQFEYVQRMANASADAGPDTVTGVDPLIGQGKRGSASYPLIWDAHSATKPVESPPQAVTMKGGEYFFAPSLAFLRSL
jgi:Dyp-type peroxidase family